MKRLLLPILALVLAAACGGDNDNGPNLGPTTSAPYSQTDLVVGTGALAGPGSFVTVAYTGWLHDSSRTDAKGTLFDSNTAYIFRLGTGAVIRGWDQGVSGMRVGGQRRLVIPPDLAYGSTSPGAPIPPNATLVFDIALNNVQ
ncbi:MAG TPA: FKBP-type peptidyl-prolyl cis-trans isomerase [Vicinamibacterales bacterium]|jgi:FKBP-type peptidyl-prolyl cis-trans isomerase FkpA|nr:FKBP-type peptidyl-prolyl cis-trans isomerase [Vicinamibacterales bacterium]